MGVISELSIDRDRCYHCHCVLHEHYGGQRTREVLKELDGSLCIAIVVDVTCAACGGVTDITFSEHIRRAIDYYFTEVTYVQTDSKEHCRDSADNLIDLPRR